MSWEKFAKHYLSLSDLDFALDISRIDFGDDFLESMEPTMQAAFNSMDELEAGAIANPDEGRMVGHYWLRNAALAPQPGRLKRSKNASRTSSKSRPTFTLVSSREPKARSITA